ncbi:immunoglobulin-like domain-containing protein, partial [Bacteroidota bacterium]
VTLNSILDPAVLALGNNPLTVRVMNMRNDTVRWFDLAYQVGNGTPVSVSNIYPPSPLGPGSYYDYTFATPINISTPGTYTISSWVSNANDSMPDNKPNNDTLTVSLCTGMSGTYTLGGSGAAFPTFTSAVQALSQCGVSAPVVFEVAAGTYNERIEIPEIIGASATNTITFEGLGTSKPVLTYNATSTTNFATVLLNGADYIHFENIEISNYGTSYASAVWLTSGADYNVVDNCNLYVTSGTSGNMIAVTLSGSTTSYSTYGNSGNYNVFSNNDIMGGYWGVHAYGSSSTSIILGNEYLNNDIHDYYYYGMYMYYCGDQVIAYNRVTPRKTGSYTASAYGIYNAYGRSDIISGNIVKAGQYGIYSYRQNYYFQTGAYHSYVVNNMVSDFSNPTYQIGIYTYYNYYTHITNNSIWVDGSYGSSYSYAALYAYYNYYCEIVNNILISTSGNLVLSLYAPSNTICDYNMYLYSGSTGYRFSMTGSYYYNFTTFKANTSYGTHDANSLDQIDPEIRSQSDLHLQYGSEGYIGTLISFPTDVDGDPRCMLQSWIGADEPYHKPQNVNMVAQDTVCLITPVTFYNTGIESEPHYNEWLVNDNFETNDFNMSYSFTQSGIDTIELRMLTCGSNDTFVKFVYVEPPTQKPVSEFMAEKNIVEVDEEIDIIDISDNCPVGWSWQITPVQVIDPASGLLADAYTYKNGTGSTTQSQELVFNYPGKYTVSLTTSNAMGTSSVETKVNYINVKFVTDMCGSSMESAEEYGNLYDDGGKSGNYAVNGFCSYTIKACGDDVKITFLEFNLNTESYLRLYDGATNRGTPLWNIEEYPDGISGYIGDAGFDTILMATESGMVYVEFEKGKYTASGFKLEWAAEGTGNYLAPVAEFSSADTGCVVTPFTLNNTSFADPKYALYSWDYDGNGIMDDHSEHGHFLANFPGVIAQYRTSLVVENCGGIDTFTRDIYLINPQSAPTGDFFANIESPVKAQDIVTLSFEPDRLSCADEFEWEISPSDYYFENGTDMYSANPQVVFKTLDSFTVTLTAGNSNSPFTSTILKSKYIIPKEYCSPFVLNLHQDVGISRVNIGSIDNYSSIGQQGYTNYSNTAAAELVVDQTYSITLERNTTFNDMDRIVWIDLDNNGAFDNTEIVTSEMNSRTTSWTGSLYIPKTAMLGATIMRIGASYSGYKSDPCGPFQFGEFEDYRVFISPDNTPPVITLIGNATEYVEQGYTYTDPGATAWDNLQGNITKDIVVENNVNTKTVGGYFVYYDICDSLNNCAETVKRLVIVTPDQTPPEITLFGGDPLSVNVNVPFNDTNYIATDLVDGNITSKVIITSNVNTYVLGEYTATYTVKDNIGLMDTKSRGIVVKDVAAPDITLDGDAVMYVEILTPFVDPGVTYSDNYWSNTKISFVTNGIVDTTKVGTYMISYEVTDASGNGPNSVTRTVIVWDSTAPEIVVNGPDEVVIDVNNDWTDPGVLITDNSISGFNVEVSGTFYKYFGNGTETMFPDSIGLFSIFYEVTDEAGNVSDMIARIVRVVDVECPVLELIGDLYITIEKWGDDGDEGYTVSDNYYDKSEIMVDTFSNVNVHEPGLYQVVYTASDPSNKNCASVV